MNDFSLQDFEQFIYVENSPIHGKGIHTSVFIPKGSNILVIQGEVISGDECERREIEENNVYIFWNGDNYIDAVKTEKIKYVNHNCDSNCEVQDRDANSLRLVAAKDIHPEDELTIDYGYEEIYEQCQCDYCSNFNEDKI